LRLTRNCNWNQCLFCPVYKNERFSRRTVSEIKQDIDTIAAIIGQVREVSESMGFSGRVDRSVLQYFYDQDVSSTFLSVAAWLYFGTGAVFLQDANNLILESSQLVDILNYLREKVPGVDRVTSYARAHTAARKAWKSWRRFVRPD
jgi:hypothetical protein